MADRVKTLQDNIKSHQKDLTQYSSFLGGLNVKNGALEQYDPFKGGYGRIFFTKMPVFMEVNLPEKTKKFKHILEYGNTKIDGLGNKTMDFETITGGYAGAQFEIPTVLKDDTTAITISTYEYSGSPLRDYVAEWLNGISDQLTGLTHYNGAMEIDDTIVPSQSNQTAEAIYVLTDSTGKKIEYATLLCNMVPKGVRMDHLDYESGQHPIAQIDIEFTTTKYESIQINEMAKLLLEKNQILRDYKSMTSGYTADTINAMPVDTITDWQ
ncbi:MAG: hypothetical protein PHF63_00410 [Herbinix sp.]|nr:hypothetical protein [Herbinix sp.]